QLAAERAVYVAEVDAGGFGDVGEADVRHRHALGRSDGREGDRGGALRFGDKPAAAGPRQAETARQQPQEAPERGRTAGGRGVAGVGGPGGGGAAVLWAGPLARPPPAAEGRLQNGKGDPRSKPGAGSGGPATTRVTIPVRPRAGWGKSPAFATHAPRTGTPCD